MKRYINYFLLSGNGSIRTAQHDGKEHMVVPVIALVEGVVWAYNSEHPEFVSAEVLSKSVNQWEDRPVVIDHPAIGDKRVTANHPEIQEQYAVGFTKNARMDGKQLKMEAWVDPEKMASLNEDSQKLLEALQNNEMLEVSIGAFVKTEKRNGYYGDDEYFSEWVDLASDHLALLPKGLKGACSNQMGCGALRVASLHIMSTHGLIKKELPMIKISELRERMLRICLEKGSTPEQIREYFRSLEITDQDLRRSLDAALSAEAGYLWLESILLESQRAVYAIETMGQVRLYSRDYTLVENNNVELGEEREEVRAETNFVPVKASANPDCKCNKEEVTLMVKDQENRIKALVENSKTPWTEQDMKYLKEMDEDRLSKVEQSAAEMSEEVILEPTEPTESGVEESTESKVDVRKVIEEELGLDVDEAKRLIEESKARAASRKKELIANLDGQKIYTKEELEAMQVKDLEKLVSLSTASDKTVDNTLNGSLPRSEDDEAIPAPKTLSSMFKEKEMEVN